MLMRILRGAALCGLMLLTSCNYVAADAEALLHPPTLNRQQAALETAIDSQNIVYKYPQRGDNLSPFVFYDLNGNGVEEAVVFYSNASDLSSTRAKILAQGEDGSWIPLHDVATANDQVDFVQFANLLSAETSCMIVGWQRTDAQSGRTEKTLSIYSMEGDNVSTDISDQPYIDYLIANLRGDGLDELITVQRGRDQSLYLSLLRTVGRHISVTDTEPLNESADVLLQMQSGPLWDRSGAVYMDVMRIDGFYATEIFSVSDEGLQAVAGGADQSQPDAPVPAWENYLDTLRDDPILCRDYDGDGKIELPFPISLPGTVYDGEEAPLKLTLLMQLSEQGFVPVNSAVINEEDGYLVLYPEKWVDRVTVQRSAETSEWRFYVVDPETGGPTIELLRIQTVYDSAASAEAAGRITLGSRGSRHYFGYIPLAAEGAPSITEEELYTMFRLLG